MHFEEHEIRLVKNFEIVTEVLKSQILLLFFLKFSSFIIHDQRVVSMK